ncbi:conserved hypothetical protein [Candida dubliniensis CD36]|uniref:Uncharacterized protein n=1 Tax=Candida dubliniensis (strain CD36 / ATCC MYA-646 / CBS 7987 / NCPF 3949 / NRRL Y-17841) TaxID=573826 RepID=B9WIX9_CANDC|nr:conserved hypothetical protein [Candida dubliniensis CD36]CAX41197.1 conserved hypothetical protein [Candida dubliniensis CD36]
MSLTSIHTIESILSQLNKDVQELDIPTLYQLSTTTTTSTNTTIPKASPYITKFKLIQIKNSLTNLNNQFHANFTSSNKYYHNVKQTLDKLYINEIDEKLYIVDKLIIQYDQANSPTASNSGDDDNDQQKQKQEGEQNLQHGDSGVITNDEELSSLRQRLLSSSKLHQINQDNNNDGDTTKLNEYHESIQDDIVNELSELTSTLKSKAIEFSSKLLNQDSDILQQTHDNLSINRTMFDTLNKNLNDYLLNKTGWSISIWTLIKFAVALIVIFVVMLLFIIIVPRIR